MTTETKINDEKALEAGKCVREWERVSVCFTWDDTQFEWGEQVVKQM